MAITIVGLGPGPAGWISLDGQQALRAPDAHVVVRTAHHPAVEALGDVPSTAFDPLYEAAASLGDVTDRIVERLTTLHAEWGALVYAVPGDGSLGEVALARLRERGIPLRVIPGVGLAGGALAAAGLSPVEGVQSVDAGALGGTGLDLQVELNPRWPAVVTGVFNRTVAGEVKLALTRVYPAEHEVIVVRHPGLADEAAVRLPLAELDRGRVDLDHLTHVVAPAVAGFAAMGSTHELRSIIARLRAPEIGCPWDLKQTHASLAPFVVEEAYEVVEAIEDGDPAELMDELGDVLLQVVLHAEVADQAGEFELNDVVRALSAKLIRRHPHVFGEVEVDGAEEVIRNWDAIKKAERANETGVESALGKIPRSLPALKQAGEMARQASKVGFDWPTRAGTVAKVEEELRELLAAESLAERREEVGDLLYVLAKLATQDGIDPEEALRAANRKFARRFARFEHIARERGWDDLRSRPVADLLDAWNEAKRQDALPGAPTHR